MLKGMHCKNLSASRFVRLGGEIYRMRNLGSERWRRCIYIQPHMSCKGQLAWSNCKEELKALAFLRWPPMCVEITSVTCMYLFSSPFSGERRLTSFLSSSLTFANVVPWTHGARGMENLPPYDLMASELPRLKAEILVHAWNSEICALMHTICQQYSMIWRTPKN